MKTCFLLLLLFIKSNEVYGKVSHTSFSKIKLELSASRSMNTNLLNSFWIAKPGFAISAETPFYFGLINLGVLSIPFKGKEEEYSDFRQNLIFIGLGTEIILPYNFYFYSGIKTGYLLMNFADNNLNLHEKSESEFTAGINFRLSFEIINDFIISASSDFTVLFTKEKLKFYYLSGSIAYRFNSPDWFQDFFN